jgi:5'(3')-deoxyribonucleotidase
MNNNISKKKLYFDMDGVLADFGAEMNRIRKEEPELEKQFGAIKNIPGLFAKLVPVEGAVDAVKWFDETGKFDLYVLSSSPWNNHTAASEKEQWIQKYFGDGEDSIFFKRVILTHQKDLVIGDFLIDDMLRNGSDKFQGKHIHFGQITIDGDFTNWANVIDWFKNNVI